MEASVALSFRHRQQEKGKSGKRAEYPERIRMSEPKVRSFWAKLGDASIPVTVLMAYLYAGRLYEDDYRLAAIILVLISTISVVRLVTIART